MFATGFRGMVGFCRNLGGGELEPDDFRAVYEFAARMCGRVAL